MKYGFVLPSGDARDAAELASLAESAGWDGFFVWEPVWGVDAWVSLAAAAMATSTIRLGTMLTPVSRRRPWKLASETATVDRLSNGRLTLSVGLGAVDSGFASFGEVTDRRTRAGLLDEGLDIVTGLWRGQPFAYEGKHYHVNPSEFMPVSPPVQQPRIPIWCAGAWGRPRSMSRALRYDGLLPQIVDESGARAANLEEVREIAAFLRIERPSDFDLVVDGETPAADAAAASDIVRPWADAGATWWNETIWGEAGKPGAVDASAARLRAGPPRAAS